VTINQLKQLVAIKIMEAANGAEAMKIRARQPITLILSDWNMPVISRLVLLLSIRSDPKLFALPLMMIIPEAERYRVMLAIRAVVSELPVKPYTAGRQSVPPVGRLSSSGTHGPGTHASCGNTGAGKTNYPRGRRHAGQSHPAVRSLQGGLPCPHCPPLQGGAEHRAVRHAARSDSARHHDAGHRWFRGGAAIARPPASEHIPVIFVTTMTGEDARLKGMELGTVDFVTKPIDPHALQIRIRNFMRYVELHRRLQATATA
jgi:PleD family two-component response regulator